MTTIKPIQTTYKGYNFRSRLEARWAVFFDALGLKWEYEPEGFELKSGRYLPDFKVYYPGRCDSEKHFQWFECKGDLTSVTQGEWARMIEFSDRVGLIVLDGVPDTIMYRKPKSLVSRCDLAAEEGEPVPTPYKTNRESASRDRCGWALWSGKGRLWWDERCNFFSPTTYFGSGTQIEDAVIAARSARFEHGQSGATL